MSRRSSVIQRESAETKPVQAETPAVEHSYRHLVPWLLLFAGSGCAALIYEIVWFQLLQLVIGSSRIYAFLEFGIAALAIGPPIGVLWISRIDARCERVLT